MFNVDDRVIVKEKDNNGRTICGWVLEIDGSRIYIELDNGVEMEFDKSSLMLESELDVIHLEQKTPANKVVNKFPTYIPERGDRGRAQKVVDNIKSVFPDILRAAEDHIDNFGKMDAFDKISALSTYTGTPMVVWMSCIDYDGMLKQVIVKTMLDNMSVGSNLAGDVLLARVSRVIGSTLNAEDNAVDEPGRRE